MAAGTAVGVVPLVGLFGATAYAQTSGSVTVSGYGVGTGVGASQYGEAGYAIEGHETYQQILSYFYGGTHLASVGDQTVSVELSQSANVSNIIFSADGMVVNGNNILPDTAVEVTPDGSGYSLSESVSTVASCSSSMTFGSPMTVSNVAIDPSVSLSVGSMLQETQAQGLTWCSPSGSQEFRGSLTTSDSMLVNDVGLQSYVEGVVAHEMPASWGLEGSAGPQSEAWGFQGLEAQAVEVRSYVLANLGGYGAADICDTSACQVYDGFNTDLDSLPSYYEAVVRAAVVDTEGQVIEMPSGSVADATYTASDGGYTAGGPFPAVVDQYDGTPVGSLANPYHSWTASVPVSQIENSYPQIGTLTGITVIGRNGDGADGGRVTDLTISGTSGSVTVTGQQFAWDFDLNSDWFVLSGPVAITNDAVSGSAFVVASSDGAVAAGNGAAFEGDTYTVGDTGLGGSRPLGGAIVGIAAAPNGQGYWLAGADGGVFTFGSGAGFYGTTYSDGLTGLSGAHPLNKPVVGIVPTPNGQGYWLVAADGGVFSFGDASFYGSMGGKTLDSPVVGMASTPNGQGYWLVQANGGVIPFGNAQSFGSMAGKYLNKPVVGIVPTANGQGYWLVAADGGVFSFGDASFYGSLGGDQLSAPAVSIVAGSSDAGYSIVLANGQVVGFGDGVSDPSLGAQTTGYGAPVVGMIA